MQAHPDKLAGLWQSHRVMGTDAVKQLDSEVGRTEKTKFRVSRLFWAGLILFVLGSGPLLSVIVLASLGMTKDPNPNPVGLGIIAALTFPPSVILIILGAVRSCSRYKSQKVCEDRRP
jgi:hypothetical protein